MIKKLLTGILASTILTSTSIPQEEIEFRRDERTGNNVFISKNRLERYDSWVDSTKKWSDENDDYAIVVDKFSRRLDLYHNGEIDKSFKIGLGFDPVSDKYYEGDGSTPEGFYKVNWLRDGEEVKTSFYKALMINYPTKEDSLEFSMAKEKGLIPEWAESPGGHIEIHGFGSESDWTLGCMALDNEDMDYLFDKVKFATPVTIVKYQSE